MSGLDDPVLDRWITTWVRLRERRLSTVDGWPLVHVESSSRRTELVCVDPGETALRALLPHVAGVPDAMLTVVGHDLSAYRSMSLPADVRVDRDDETLMTATMPAPGSSPVPAPPDGLTATWEEDGPRIVHRLDDGGRVAAEATMAIDDGWVTFDGVETTPGFRRRGLGRHVISTMTRRAAGLGARHGVLAASADGRALYESLGWVVEREMLSLMGTEG